MMFGTFANVAEHLTTGKLRAVAATTPKRFEELPNLPTVAESGPRTGDELALDNIEQNRNNEGRI